MDAPSVLLIGTVWPEPTSSAAGVRDLNLVEAFLGEGWRVFYCTPCKPNDHEKRLIRLGVKTARFEANDSGFDDWVREVSPDYVIFDRFVMEEQFSFRVREQCPGSVRILDTQDLHFVRRSRQRNSSLEIGADFDFSACDDALRELAAVFRSDLTLVLSDFEHALLRNELKIPDQLLQLCRFFYPNRSELLPSYEDRRHFVMIGNFRHPPNLDAVHWLNQEIWPRMQKLLNDPGIQVHLYGAYPPKEVSELNDPQNGFWVRGWVEDQYETLKNYRVNLAPLRFGAGIKGKITDGWWCGTPVVTTPVGAEGMAGELSWGGLISSDADEFARQAVTLYASQQTWSLAQKRGFQILDQEYSFQKSAPVLIRRLESLRNNLDSARRGNWIGAMLWYHGNRSTTYFSRWIEEKNKHPAAPLS